MAYPLLSEYVEAIKAAEDNFEQLKHLRPLLDDDDQPVMTSGNFAVVFKMKNEQTGKLHAVKCFLRDQEGRAEAYRMIAEELEYVNSTYLTPIKYLDKELFVDTNQTDETEFPVLLMDWVEGVTLDKYIRENIYDEYALSLLAYQFSRLAMWLMPQPFAHGDLKPDNILVKDDGTLVLVDYDGMYVPAMKGQKARELGSPDFRHPSRTEDDFDEHIDDFSLVSILLSLKAISLQPSLLEQYGASDRLLFSEKDYRNLSESQVMDAIKAMMIDSELATLYSLFILSASQNNLSQVSFRLLNLARPKEPEYENLSTKVTEEDLANAWTDEYGVMYSKDRKRLLCVYGSYLPDYEIPEGTEVICDDSLNGFWSEIEDLMISGKIIIPSSVRFIGRNPFRGDYDTIICKSPHFVVENGALYTSNRKRLISCFSKESEFIIPDGVEQIGSFAFYACDISRILIPESVSYIGDNPLISLNYLSQKPIEVVSQSRFFKLTENTLYDVKNKKLISFFGKGKHLSVLEGTRIIKDYAFGYTDLEYLSLPNSIDTIGHYIFFYAWENLKTILIPNGSTKNFEELLPEYKDKLKEQEDDDNLSTKVTGEDLANAWTDEYGVKYSKDRKKLLQCNRLIKEYSVKDGTIVICDNAFLECGTLKEIHIPDSVTKIGTGTFSDCSSLSEIYIPDSVTEIGDWAFMRCRSLSEIHIPDSVTEIGDGAFSCCCSLSEIHIPDSVTRIEDGAFFVCSSLSVIHISNSVTKIGYRAFAGCRSLSEIHISNSVTEIGDYAFYRCSSLSEIHIPDSVIEIGDGAFSCCSSLTSIFVDKKNKYYDSRNHCNAIIKTQSNELIVGCASTIIPDSVTRIGDEAFSDCSSLTEIHIPDSVTEIGDYAFYGCSSLSEIHIPDSVIEIGDGAFKFCLSLSEIYIPDSVTSIGNSTFDDCHSLSQIVIPTGSRSKFEEMLPEYKDKLVEVDK